MRYLYKLMGLAVIFLLLISAGMPVLYMGTYELINDVDTSIYSRYATNNKYDENIFFNTEVETSTGILSDLQENIDGIDNIKSKQEFAKVITENKEKVKQVINENSEYMKYLSDKGSSVEELMEWGEKTANLDNNILQLSLFLICMLYAGITVIIFKCRKTFYFLAGIIYTITIMSMFSGGISDYLVIKAMNIFLKFGNETLSYQDMDTMKSLFVQAYKESMVAFIIFDTIIQIVQGNRETRRKEEIKYVIYSLDYQIGFLKSFENNDIQYLSKFKIPVNTILKIIRKKQKCLDKKIKKAGKVLQYKEKLEKEKLRLNQLEEMIIDIVKFSEMRTTCKYINILSNIRILVYECNIYEN